MCGSRSFEKLIQFGQENIRDADIDLKATNIFVKWHREMDFTLDES